MIGFFVRRPIVAIVISIVLVLGGFTTMRTLPIARFPDIVPPQVVVSTSYTGADAVTVEQAVAAPIEQQMNGVDRMIYMQSTNSSDGTMTLRVSFEVGTDPDTATVLVQNRVAEAAPRLPAIVNALGVTVRKVSAAPLVVYALYSPHGTYDNRFLGNYATLNLVDELLRTPGVGDVRVFGSSDYAMRVWVNPDLLATLKLTVSDLRQAIERQSTVNPAGQLGAEPVPPGQEFTYSIRTQGRLVTAEQFAGIIVRANPDGSFLRLGEVARVQLGTESYGQLGRFDGKPSAVIAVYQLPGSNALSVAEQVSRVMAAARARFPPDIVDAISVDSTAPITEGVRDIAVTLVEALGLVILVVYLFLQSWRATLIPLLTVPVSLMGSFLIFPVLGFSINTLSLFGLVLAIGLVVDDAIVVVEAVERHIQAGEPPTQATLEAMREVAGPVVAIALVLSSVFIPVAFVSGIKGRLFQQFAITIATSVIISAFNALTLSPALCAQLLRPRGERRGPLAWFFARFNRAFGWTTERYVGWTGVLLRKAYVGVALLLAFAAAVALTGARLPTAFVPEEDQGFLYGQLELPGAASLQRTDAAMRRVEQVLARTPGIAGYTTVPGFSILNLTSSPNSGLMFIALKPWSERGSALTAFVIVERVNRELATLAEGRAFLFAPPAILGIGTSGGFDMMLEDRSGMSVQELATNVDKFLAAARQRPELARLNSSLRASVPQRFAHVDVALALKQGVDLQDVYTTLAAFMGGDYVNDFNRFGREWRVFLEAEGRFRTQADDIARYYVRSGGGAMVPLSSLVTIEPVSGPQFTTRFDLFRASEITGAAAPGYTTGDAMAALTEVAARTLPPTMGFAWSNMSYQENRAGGIAGVLVLSIVLVFLILAALYESWSLPFSILLSTPIALFGALFGLLIRGLEFDVYGEIALIMLVGLAAKNAVLIVEFAKDQLESGHAQSVEQAALAGARLRLRPILMTSFAFILGMLPLWVATGADGASRRELGSAVIVGLLTATVFGVFLVPVMFAVVERIVRWRRPPPGPTATRTAPEGPP